MKAIGIIGIVLGALALGYLVWVGIAWVFLILMAAIGFELAGSAWAWGGILLIVSTIFKAGSTNINIKR